MSEREFDPNQTTTLSAKVGGSVVTFSSKRMEVVIWFALALGLGSIGVQLWYIGEKLNFLEHRIQDVARSAREIACAQYIPEAERAKYVGQAAACRRMGEMQ